MFIQRAVPGQTVYAAWKAYSIMGAAEVKNFDLRIWDDDIMESPGHLGVLGDIVYSVAATKPPVAPFAPPQTPPTIPTP
jgi:hypothetical protein